MKSPSPISTDHPRRTCRFRLSALYWVRTKTRRRSLFRQLERVRSMMRYTPPKGTAGLARSRVSGQRRSPWPPARSTPIASRIKGIDRNILVRSNGMRQFFWKRSGGWGRGEEEAGKMRGAAGTEKDKNRHPEVRKTGQGYYQKVTSKGKWSFV